MDGWMDGWMGMMGVDGNGELRWWGRRREEMAAVKRGVRAGYAAVG